MKPSIGVWLYVKTFLTNRDTVKGFLFFLLACVFGSIAIAVMPTDSPEFFQQIVIGFVRNSSLLPAAKASAFVGLADYLFWASVVMLIGICSYIWFVRPRLIKFLFFSSVLPVLMFLVSLVPAVRSSETGPIWLIFLIFLAIWIIPFMGFLHAGYKSIVLGGGLARKAVIKSNLADNSTLLLLRCFALDNALVKRSTHIIGALDIFRLFLIRLEEVVVREAFLKAPVVAVANPEDRQEPLGAVREYLSDADWQPFVSEKSRTVRRLSSFWGGAITQDGQRSKSSRVMPWAA